MPKSSRDTSGAIVSVLQIEMMRTAVEVFLQEDGIARFADEALLCTAMFIGQAEGKPMTAAKIAEYIGMPRPSAIRKLHSLKIRGVVRQVDNRRWCIAVDVPEINARVSAAERAQRDNIRRATAKLSKMDSAAIARQK